VIGTPATVVVRMQGVSKTVTSAGQKLEILRSVDLVVRAGELYAVVGPSGSGKTTLLNLMGAMDTPTAGSVEVLGRDLTRLDEAGRTAFRRDHLGFVFQFYNLLPTLTAFENVQLALELQSRPAADTRRRAQDALAAVGLSALQGRFPAELSGGEQQRVAIARALAKSPALILADEPTGNLDRGTARGVMELMQRLSRELGATIVMVTHDDELSGQADGRLSLGSLEPGSSSVRSTEGRRIG
jgi:ABC-type lipoprotein export system ATPase subunit